jgi:hypothetical protein
VTDDPAHDGFTRRMDDMLKRQAERLANKPEAESLAAKIERVRDAGVKADEEHKADMAAKAEPIEGIITAWIPEPDPHVRAAVGKLAEELNEAAKVCARIAIQGIDGIDPASGRTNREELFRELADIMAATDVTEIFVPPPPTIDMAARRIGKRNGFLKWHGMIRDHFDNLRRSAGLEPRP